MSYKMTNRDLKFFSQKNLEMVTTCLVSSLQSLDDPQPKRRAQLVDSLSLVKKVILTSQCLVTMTLNVKNYRVDLEVKRPKGKSSKL